MESCWLLFVPDSLPKIAALHSLPLQYRVGEGTPVLPKESLYFQLENIPLFNEISLLAIAEVLLTSNRFSPCKVLFHMQLDYSCIIFILHLMLNDEGSL